MKLKGLSLAAIKRIAQTSADKTGQQADWERQIFNEVTSGLGKFQDGLTDLITSVLGSASSDEKRAELYDAIQEFLKGFYLPSDYGD